MWSRMGTLPREMRAESDRLDADVARRRDAEPLRFFLRNAS